MQKLSASNKFTEAKHTSNQILCAMQINNLNNLILETIY